MRKYINNFLGFPIFIDDELKDFQLRFEPVNIAQKDNKMNNDKIDWDKKFKKYQNKIIKEQTRKIMDLIPKLLEIYDDLPNDVKDDENLIELFNIIDEIEYISDDEYEE